MIDPLRPPEDQGTWLKVANVLLQTCDLSDEAILMFQRIAYLSQFHSPIRGTVLGSIRKIAALLPNTKSKIHRLLTDLETAGLVKLGSIDGINAIQPALSELWELNKAWSKGADVPRWKNLQSALDSVPKMGQSEEEKNKEVSQKWDNLSQIQDNSVPKIGQSVPKMGQSVPRFELKVGTKKVKSIKKEEEEGKNVGETSSEVPPSGLPADESSSDFSFSREETVQEEKTPAEELDNQQDPLLEEPTKDQEEVNPNEVSGPPLPPPPGNKPKKKRGKAPAKNPLTERVVPPPPSFTEDQIEAISVWKTWSSCWWHKKLNYKPTLTDTAIKRCLEIVSDFSPLPDQEEMRLVRKWADEHRGHEGKGWFLGNFVSFGKEFRAAFARNDQPETPAQTQVKKETRTQEAMARLAEEINKQYSHVNRPWPGVELVAHAGHDPMMGNCVIVEWKAEWLPESEICEDGAMHLYVSDRDDFDNLFILYSANEHRMKSQSRGY